MLAACVLPRSFWAKHYGAERSKQNAYLVPGSSSHFSGGELVLSKCLSLLSEPRRTRLYERGIKQSYKAVALPRVLSSCDGVIVASVGLEFNRLSTAPTFQDISGT